MSDKKWLIKNNGHILGPLTTEEVIQEWNKGFFSPFATALLPGQACWLFITNYEEFSKLKRASQPEGESSVPTQSVTTQTGSTEPAADIHKVTTSHSPPPPAEVKAQAPPSLFKKAADGDFKKPLLKKQKGGPGVLRNKTFSSRSRWGGGKGLLLYGGAAVLLLIVLWRVFKS